MSWPEPSAESPTKHDAYAAWAYPDYRRYQIAWALMILSKQMETAALAWYVYDRTQDPMALAWIGLAQAIPIMALALPAGFMADRVNRKAMLAWSLLAMSACAIGLTAASIWHWPMIVIYLLIFLAGITQGLSWPARASLLPHLVPAKVFPNAVAWNSSIFETGSLVGPMLGAFLVSLNTPLPFGVAAISQLIAWGLVLGLNIQLPQRQPEAMNLQNMTSGLRFVLSQPLILAAITLDLFAVLLGGAVYLTPIFAKEILNVGAIGFGALRAAPAVGSVTMALLQAHMPPLKHAGRALILAVIGFAVATIVFGLSKNFWLSLLAMFLIGFFDNISVIVRHTLVQMLTPDEMRGRVSSVNIIFITASNDLGGFESGITAKRFGAVASVVGGGIGALLVVLATCLKWPQIAKLGALSDIRPPLSPLPPLSPSSPSSPSSPIGATSSATNEK